MKVFAGAKWSINNSIICIEANSGHLLQLSFYLFAWSFEIPTVCFVPPCYPDMSLLWISACLSARTRVCVCTRACCAHSCIMWYPSVHLSLFYLSCWSRALSLLSWRKTKHANSLTDSVRPRVSVRGRGGLDLGLANIKILYRVQIWDYISS